MKKLFFILTVIFAISFSSCTNKDVACDQCDGIFSETITMQIDNEYATCDSLVHCLYYQIGDTIDESNWQVFNQDICGFDYTPGYRYVLSVKRNRIGTKDDGTKVYEYCLNNIISSTKVYLK